MRSSRLCVLSAMAVAEITKGILMRKLRKHPGTAEQAPGFFIAPSIA
jgi:hypothetical protein